MGKTSSPTVLYPVTLFLYESYPVGDLQVYVYQLDSQRKIEGFLVTLGDGFTENIWGHGNTPLEALQDAEATWKRIASEYENPFSLALRRREDQEDWRWS